MDTESYYTILGVSKNATPAEIKKQYRTLSLIHHPDRGGNSETFKTISEAYTTLIDDSTRDAYDMEIAFSKNGTSFAQEDVVEELFARMFAQQGNLFEYHNLFGAPGVIYPSAPPAPITHILALTIQQRYDGGRFEIHIERQYRMRRNCTTEINTCYVDVPPGARIDEVIVLHERGHSIDDLVFGNVNVIISAIPHPEFTQRGLDLVISREITLKEALCGCVIRFTHPSGKCICIDNTDNAAILSPGKVKKIGGLGFRRGTETGNLVIEFSVLFPDTFTQTQIESLREIL